MTIPQYFILMAIGIILLFSAGCTQINEEQKQTTQSPAIIMTSPFPPIPVESTGGVNIAYELELTTSGNTTLVPESIEVIDANTGKTLYIPENDVFTKSYTPASSIPLTSEELGVSENCAMNVIYLRSRSRHTPEKEAELIALHAAGNPPNMCEF